jgi:hypothetical protein
MTAQLVTLHNYNNLPAQTEFVACSKKEDFPHRITNFATKKIVPKDILRLAPRKCPSSRNTG